MSAAEIALVCFVAFAIAVLVFSAAAIVRDEANKANRRERQAAIPDLTDYIDEHQSDDAPEFRPVQRDAKGDIKLRRY